MYMIEKEKTQNEHIQHNNEQSDTFITVNNDLIVRRQTYLDSGIGENTEQHFYSFQAAINKNSIKPAASCQAVLQQDKQQQLLSNNPQQVQQQPTNKQNNNYENDNQQQIIPNAQILQTQLSQVPTQLIEACNQIAQSLITKIQLEQYRKTLFDKMQPIYSQFCKAYDNLIANIDIEQSINTYSHILVKYWNQQMFFQHFVQNHYLFTLMNKIREHKFAAQIVKAVFSCFQYLLNGLGSQTLDRSRNNKQQQFIYLLVMINKEGFITEDYKFSQSQDWAYYAHFMKLLVRIINKADKAQQAILQQNLNKQQNNITQISGTFSFSPPKLRTLRSFQYQQIYSKYLSIFFNQKYPQFPLLLKLLRFYKWPDAIIQTSVKLCLLQLSNHPNKKLQKYFLNFPFVTFYLLFSTKISDNIEKYLAISALRAASEPQSQKQMILKQQIENDMKFMQDYFKIEQHKPSSQKDLSSYSAQFSKQNNIHQHLSMYINSFLYYIGRGFYQALSKFIAEQNANGIINGMILLIKILRINSILKIKLGFQEMFHKYINGELWEYLRSKREKLDQKYWLFQQCQAIIKEHAQNILYGQEEQRDYFQSPKTNRSIYQSQMLQVSQLPTKVMKSTIPTSNANSAQKNKKPTSYSSLMFKAMKSYIPTTSSNWLYHEMKKISQVLGLEVTLNKQIQHSFQQLLSNPFYKSSFSYIIDKIQQNNYRGNNKMVLNSKNSLISRFSSPIRINPLMGGIFNLANKGCKHTNGNTNKNNGQIDKKSRKKMYQDRSQQIMYYYLVLMCSIHDPNSSNCSQTNQFKPSQNSTNLQQIYQLIKITKNCKSLMLVGIMYWYIKVIDYQLHEANNDFLMPSQSRSMNQNWKNKQGQVQKQKQSTLAVELLDNYVQTMANIVYYILTQGWQSFYKHLKQIKKVIWNKSNNNKTYSYQLCNIFEHTQFTDDIFRDIECDIVYFIMLRHIFGTRNNTIQLSQQATQNTLDRDTISKEIKVACRLTNSQGDKVFLIIDGQYFKFVTADDVLITKKPLSISSFNIYYQQTQQNTSSFEHFPIKSLIKQKQKNAVFELIDKSIHGECFTVYFQEYPIRQYVAKQIKWRKKITSDIELSLRTLRFDIQD